MRAFDQLDNEIAAEGATAVATGLRAITSMTRLSLGSQEPCRRRKIGGRREPRYVLGAAVATAFAEVVNSNTLMTCLDLTGMADKLQL
jgi:hypothetical protein